MLKKIAIQELNTLYKKGSTKKHLFVLHGYGASCQDLAPFADVLDSEQRFHWYFLDGLESLTFGEMEMGRAWFKTRMDDVLSAVAKDDFSAIDTLMRPQLQAAAKRVTEAIASVGVDPADVCICGFSQGAMMATEIALQQEVGHLLVVLSGAFAGPVHWRQYMIQQTFLQNFSVFQSHGIHDTVLQFKVAKPLKDLFEQFSLKKYEFHSFEGGHEIPEGALSKILSFINHAWS